MRDWKGIAGCDVKAGERGGKKELKRMRWSGGQKEDRREEGGSEVGGSEGVRGEFVCHGGEDMGKVRV